MISVIVRCGAEGNYMHFEERLADNKAIYKCLKCGHKVTITLKYPIDFRNV